MPSFGNNDKGGDGGSQDKQTPPFGQASNDSAQQDPQPEDQNSQTDQPDAMDSEAAGQTFQELATVASQALVGMSQHLDQDPTLALPEEAVALRNAMVLVTDLAERATATATVVDEGTVPDPTADSAAPVDGESDF